MTALPENCLKDLTCTSWFLLVALPLIKFVLLEVYKCVDPKKFQLFCYKLELEAHLLKLEDFQQVQQYETTVMVSVGSLINGDLSGDSYVRTTHLYLFDSDLIISQMQSEKVRALC